MIAGGVHQLHYKGTPGPWTNRALLELKMLWPYAIGTPENPRGV